MVKAPALLPQHRQQQSVVATSKCQQRRGLPLLARQQGSKCPSMGGQQHLRLLQAGFGTQQLAQVGGKLQQATAVASGTHQPQLTQLIQQLRRKRLITHRQRQPLIKLGISSQLGEQALCWPGYRGQAGGQQIGAQLP
mgnify:FL=1